MTIPLQKIYLVRTQLYHDSGWGYWIGTKLDFEVAECHWHAYEILATEIDIGYDLQRKLK